MRSPLVTALVVAPLLGFNLASAVDLCASSWTAAPSAVVQRVSDDAGACAGAADRWAARAWSLAEPEPAAVVAAQEAYRQGCSDARAALAAGR